MAELDEGDKKLLSDIDAHGWHVVLVTGDETGPGFGYTVGLYKTFRHPEVILLGLNLDLIHALLNNIGENIRKGQTYIPGEAFGDILDDYNCYMIDVAPSNYAEYTGYASWYYKHENYPVLQCVYPNRNSVFPWQDEWPEALNALQPLLGDAKIYQ